MRLRKDRLTTILLVALVGIVAGLSCGGRGSTDRPVTSSLSYRGHENDADSNNLVRAFPDMAGTRLDDCQTCHRGGEVVEDRRGVAHTKTLNPCSYCHLIPFPEERVEAGAPVDYAHTLNSFGEDYREAGRNASALHKISERDSDGDGFLNSREIADHRYPGDAASRPGQPVVPLHTLQCDDLLSCVPHEQMLLMNSHRQKFDTYALYRGVTVEQLLVHLGVDLNGVESVTFIAPDGFAIDIAREFLYKRYPPGPFTAAKDPGSFAHPDQGFVHYPPREMWPAGVADGVVLPQQPRIMIAYAHDGEALEPARLDPKTGTLEGEGPYRLIVPQGYHGTPGTPDRGSSHSPSPFAADGFDYDDNKDHNAGFCTRGLVAMRINPLPEGYEEYDWKNGGFALLERQAIMVYGAGITAGR